MHMSQSTLDQLLIHSVSIKTLIECWLKTDGDLGHDEALIEMSNWSSVSINTQPQIYLVHIIL